MGKIYTRTGDKGTTGIHGGQRVEKDDVRIEANGAIDELNAHIGIIRSMMADDDERQTLLHVIQKELMVTMSLVATPAALRGENPNTFDVTLVKTIERQMDVYAEKMGTSRHFLLPGGTPLAAQLHLARTVCRRAERRLWTLHREDAVPEGITEWMNRLSDYLFVMARYELFLTTTPEEQWNHFGYKRKKDKI